MSCDDMVPRSERCSVFDVRIALPRVIRPRSAIKLKTTPFIGVCFFYLLRVFQGDGVYPCADSMVADLLPVRMALETDGVAIFCGVVLVVASQITRASAMGPSDASLGDIPQSLFGLAWSFMVFRRIRYMVAHCGERSDACNRLCWREDEMENQHTGFGVRIGDRIMRTIRRIQRNVGSFVCFRIPGTVHVGYVVSCRHSVFLEISQFGEGAVRGCDTGFGLFPHIAVWRSPLLLLACSVFRVNERSVLCLRRTLVEGEVCGL